MNPYKQWLGVAEETPNHYQILGVSTGESDVDRLRDAAQRALDRLKHHTDPASTDVRKRIAQQVKTAFSVLSQAEQRARYDAALGLGIETPDALPRDLGVHVSNPNESQAIVTGIPIRTREKRSPARRSAPWIWIAIVAIFIAGPLIAIALMIWSSKGSNVSKENEVVASNRSAPLATAADTKNAGERELPSTPPPTEIAELPDNASAEKPPNESVVESQASAGMAAPVPHNHTAEPPSVETTETDDLKSAPLGRETRFLIAWAKARIAALDFDGADRILSSPGNVGDYEMAVVRDWALLAKDIRSCWQEIDEHAERLRAAREFDVWGDVASVVGIEPRHLLFRWRGQTLVARWDRLPSAWMFALIETVGIRDLPTWRKLTAAWRIAYDDGGDGSADDLRQQLEQCRSDGLEVDYLVRLLDKTLLSADVENGETDSDVAMTTEVVIGVLRTPLTATAQPRSNEYEQLLDLAHKSQDGDERRDALIRALRLSVREMRWERCREVLAVWIVEQPLDQRAVLLECARQISQNSELYARDAELIVAELIELSGRGWRRGTGHPLSELMLELARELAERFRMRLQLNQLSVL